MTIKFRDGEYTVSTTLRVAYELQKKHNHRSYMEIFGKMSEMSLEDQINFIYLAFNIANPELHIAFKDFLDYYLDNCTLDTVMGQMKEIMEGITGRNLDDEEETSDKAVGESDPN